MAKMTKVTVIAGSALAAGTIMMGAFAPIASAAPSGPQNQSNQNQSNQNPGNHQQTPTQKRITTFGSCAALNRTYPHGVARAGVAIVTCMDSRIDPLRMVGLAHG
ncbi:MAG TPA: hypothetical protein PLC22_23930, partial [Gordonia sp. (in: high G+C Gram-positive bacteria)]|nr:hypothetical protein [Gordonia sp. (in: high G+C Gram-positive bacteria)]